MKSIARILGVTVAMLSLTCVSAFASDSDSDEVIDKGRRGGFGGRSFSAPRVQQPRPQFRAPAQRVVTPPRQQSFRAGPPSTQSLRINQGAQVRQQQQSGQIRHQQSSSTNAPQRSPRVEQTTRRVPSVSGQQPRMPENGYRPGIFNSPQYGDVAVWSAGQGRQNARPGFASTTTSARPSGRLDDIASTRLVKPNPFPGQSVEPQFLDRPGALAPVPSSRSTPARNTIGSNFIGSGTQPNFINTRKPNLDSLISQANSQANMQSIGPASPRPETPPTMAERMLDWTTSTPEGRLYANWAESSLPVIDGAIGFAIAGPPGAAIGATIGAAESHTIGTMRAAYEMSQAPNATAAAGTAVNYGLGRVVPGYNITEAVGDAIQVIDRYPRSSPGSIPTAGTRSGAAIPAQPSGTRIVPIQPQIGVPFF